MSTLFYSLVGEEDANPVGTGEFVHVAGAVGAVMELVRRIGAVFLSVTHKAERHTARVAGKPGGAGELVGTAGLLA